MFRPLARDLVLHMPEAHGSCSTPARSAASATSRASTIIKLRIEVANRTPQPGLQTPERQDHNDDKCDCDQRVLPIIQRTLSGAVRLGARCPI